MPHNNRHLDVNNKNLTNKLHNPGLLRFAEHPPLNELIIEANPHINKYLRLHNPKLKQKHSKQRSDRTDVENIKINK